MKPYKLPDWAWRIYGFDCHPSSTLTSKVDYLKEDREEIDNMIAQLIAEHMGWDTERLATARTTRKRD